jgi:hypothetical protein
MNYKEKMKLIYVAGAYTGKTPEEIDLNIQAAAKVGQIMVRKGWYPVIPHLNTAGFDRTASEIPYQYWIDGTLALMARCDAVCMVDGWLYSNGAKGEVTEANNLGLPIYYNSFTVPDRSELVHGIPGGIDVSTLKLWNETLRAALNPLDVS